MKSNVFMRPMSDTAAGSAESGISSGTQGLTPAELKDGRRAAVQYVYQLELTQQHYFQDRSYEVFCEQLSLSPKIKPYARFLVKGLIERLSEIDTLVEAHSKNWKISRIGKVDLAIIRVCSFELLERTDIVPDIVIADAAEIGKQFGSSQSGAFVHGVLDGIVKAKRAKA